MCATRSGLDWAFDYLLRNQVAEISRALQQGKSLPAVTTRRFSAGSHNPSLAGVPTATVTASAGWNYTNDDDDFVFEYTISSLWTRNFVFVKKE